MDRLDDENLWSIATARRDTEGALAMLEETAAKLPRDLREVFWDDPRRRALRQAHSATVVAPVFSAVGSSAVARSKNGTAAINWPWIISE